jgi:hypothetical protein
VQIVDYRPHKPGSLPRRWLSASPCGCVRKWEQNWKRLLFEQFRKKNLTRTPEVFRSASELRKIADRYDLLITGSDQVWNPRWLDQVDGFWDLYFLSFAGANTKRISYAASIGHGDISTLSESWQRQMKERLAAMNAISVREQSSVDLVQTLCGRSDAICVADPTLLLDRVHYDQLAGPRKKKKKYVFSYMLHGLEQDAAAACRTVAEHLELKMVRCNAAKTGLHTGYSLPSPEGWLRQIRDAGFVVTNSFHCTVFCLIFHVPFVAVLIDGEIGSMNSRITDLLKSVGLEDRIVSPGAKLTTGLVSEAINWDGVDWKLVEARNGAVSFLTEQELAGRDTYLTEARTRKIELTAKR